MHAPARITKTKVIILYGQSGCGKSHAAHYLAAQYGDVYVMSSKWADGYSSHAAVIMDEFNGWIPFSMFKTITDKYSYSCQIKGAHVPWVPKVLIITTNTDPLFWYVDHLTSREHYEAFTRRIDEYWVCTNFVYRKVRFPGYNNAPPTQFTDIGQQIQAIEAGADFDDVMGKYNDVMSINKTWV